MTKGEGSAASMSCISLCHNKRTFMILLAYLSIELCNFLTFRSFNSVIYTDGTITFLRSIMLCAHQCLKYVLLRSLCGAKSSPPSALIRRSQFPCHSSFWRNGLPIAKVFGVARAAPVLHLQQNSRRYGHAQWVRYQPVVERLDLYREERQIVPPSQPTMHPIQGAPVYGEPELGCE